MYPVTPAYKRAPRVSKQSTGGAYSNTIASITPAPNMTSYTESSEGTRMPSEILTSYYDYPTHDQESWWRDTGPLFGRFLKGAGYDVHTQYQYLVFFIKNILPSLGPYPARWRSTITPTGLPIEYSLNFQKNSRPLLRIGFEPLSRFSGTAQDPYNKIATADLLNQLAKVQLHDFDTQLFNHFMNDFDLSRAETETLQKQGGINGKSTVRSQTAFGFDLKGGRVSIKGYAFAGLKNRATGIPVGQLISDSVRKLEPQMHCWDSFSILNDYMEKSDGWNEYSFVSWDCVDIERSRLKLYGVHNAVTWEKVKEMWTLGGRIEDDATIKAGLELLQHMWALLRIDEGNRDYKGGFAADNGGKTLPIIWNYEINKGSPHPAPKFYFPVHGENDLQVSKSISEFFSHLGWDDHARQYSHLLRQI